MQKVVRYTNTFSSKEQHCHAFEVSILDAPDQPLWSLGWRPWAHYGGRPRWRVCTGRVAQEGSIRCSSAAAISPLTMSGLRLLLRVWG